MENLNERESRVAVLLDSDIQTFSDEKKELSRKELAKAKLYPHLNIVETEKEKEKKALTAQNISFEGQSFVEETIEPEFETEVHNEVENNFEEDVFEDVDEEVEEEIIDDIEEEISEEIEEELEEIVEEKKEERAKVVYQNAKKKNLKLRLKLAFCAAVCVLTCLGGWAIYNAVEIKTLTAEAQAKNAEYNINVATIISNVSKLDDLTNPNSITNLDELEKANIVEIIPREKVEPKKVEKQSNWFDRVCNWLSNLFN